MDLRGFEANVTSGTPVVGATVQVREANLLTPNVTAVLASTTTDANGVWSFSGLSDTPKDVEITYSGQVWRYRGLSRLSTDAVYINGAVATAQQFPLIRNGSFERWDMGTGPVALGTSATRFADVWFGTISGGSSGSATRETTIVAAGSNTSVKLIFTRVAGVMQAYFSLPSILVASMRSKEIWASAQLRQGVTNNTRLFIRDSAATSYGSTNATTGAFVTLTSSRTIDAAATSIDIGIEMAASDTAYLDNVAMLIGSLAPVFGPNSLDAYMVQEYVTVDSSVTTTSNSNTLQTTLNAIVGRIKAIAGTTNWYDAPASTIAALLTNVNTRVLRVGDTMTGLLQVVASLNGSMVLQLWNQHTSGLGLAILNAAGSSFDFIISHTQAVFGVPIAGTSATFSGSVDATTDVSINGTSVKSRSIHTGTQTPSTISPQGSGSGLDADTTDGFHAAGLVNRVNHTGTQAPSTISPQGSGSALDADTTDSFHASVTPAATTIAVTDGTGKLPNSWLKTGSGNGLDADTVDGLNPGNGSGTIPLSNGTVNTNLNADMTDGFHASATSTANTIPVGNGSGKLSNAWLNTGSGNGLDADTVDGSHASAFATSGHTHNISATGSYTGNGAGARVITNSLGWQPKLVVISGPLSTALIHRDNVTSIITYGGSPTSAAGGSLDASGFTVPSGLNVNTSSYTWMAVA